jgi:hypothetical protein
MLTEDVSKVFRLSSDTPPPIGGVETALDWSGRLSIDMIRQHTKTDDIPGVTDDQLALYRAAAVETAEAYTGRLLSVQRTINEPAQGPPMPRFGKTFYKLRLRYPVADGIVYLYGGKFGSDNITLRVPVNTRVVTVPVRYGVLDLSNCCDPCAQNNGYVNNGMMVMYKAGFKSAADVPNLIVLGCLQYIAWVIEHPGDEILTVRNRRDARSEGAQGTNNVAIASGALESWRLVDEDIV